MRTATLDCATFSPRSGLILFSIAVAIMLTSVPLRAQVAEPGQPVGPGVSNLIDIAAPSTAEITSALIGERRQQLEANATIDATQRAKLASLYDQAEASLIAAETVNEQAGIHKNMSATSATATDELRQQMELRPPTDKIPLQPGATTTELEKRLTVLDGALEDAKKARLKAEAELQRRRTRRAELPRSIAARKVTLADLRGQLTAIPPVTTADATQLAQRTVIRARLQELDAQLAAEESEIPAYDATAKLLDLQRDVASQQVAALDKQIAAVRAAARARREEETTKQILDVRSELAKLYPSLRSYIDNSLRLARERQELTEELKRTRAELDESRARFEATTQQVERARAKINAIGLNEATGLLLRKQRTELAEPEPLLDGTDERQDRIRDIHMRILDLESRKSTFGSIAARVDNMVTSMNISGTSIDPDTAREVAEQIAQQELDFIDALLADYGTLFNELVEQDETRKQHAELVEQQIDYIDERTLWVRSNRPLEPNDFVLAYHSFVDMFSWTRIKAIGGSLLRSAGSYRLVTGLMVLFFCLGLYFASRLKKRLRAIGRNVLDSRMAPMRATGQAIVLTLAISAIWPALIGFIGWSITNAPLADEYSRMVGGALFRMAWLLLPLELLRQILRPVGLGIAHFHWPDIVCQRGRASVRFVLLFAAPLAFLVVLTAEFSGPARDNELGRLAFIAVMILIAVATWRLLSTNSPARLWIRSSVADVWVVRTVPLFATLLITAPIALAIAAGLGYYYTATKLSWKFTLSMWLIVGLLMLAGAIVRWLVIARTRLARSRAREITSASDVASDAIDDRELDAVAVSAQSKQLLHLVMLVFMIGGMWLIWHDVTPALRKLDEFEIIPVAGAGDTPAIVEPTVIENPVAGVIATPAPVADAPPVGNGLSVADIGLAFLATILFVAILRNLPGTLELLVLQRLPLDAGGRFAVSSICRYILIVVGVMLVASLLGIRWTNVQWLVAAITVGLGFGLQEIFANFVSGIILLLERPMRIGDIVTVGEVTGSVTRIQMRATTVTNWDRQELIVPNKEFVTGRLLNWTLSNQVTRLVINVGVAYGSDTDRAIETLRRVIDEHPNVLDDPKPLVSFEQFGDSSLNFVCRTYLPNLDKRLQTNHELHTRIDLAFREAGIEIAFPQSDIHIRTIDRQEAQLPVVNEGHARPEPRNDPA